MKYINNIYQLNEALLTDYTIFHKNQNDDFFGRLSILLHYFLAIIYKKSRQNH